LQKNVKKVFYMYGVKTYPYSIYTLPATPCSHMGFMRHGLVLASWPGTVIYKERLRSILQSIQN